MKRTGFFHTIIVASAVVCRGWAFAAEPTVPFRPVTMLSVSSFNGSKTADCVFGSDLGVNFRLFGH
jgi:hypothetical protein